MLFANCSLQNDIKLGWTQHFIVANFDDAIHINQQKKFEIKQNIQVKLCIMCLYSIKNIYNVTYHTWMNISVRYDYFFFILLSPHIFLTKIAFKKKRIITFYNVYIFNFKTMIIVLNTIFKLFQSV
jgi:hypothetical protein